MTNMTTDTKTLILDVSQQDTKPSLEIAAWSEFLLSYTGSDHSKHLRLGQGFHQHFKLEKVTSQLKEQCDRIYYEPDRKKAMSLIFNTFDIS